MYPRAEFSNRERQVIDLLFEGKSNKQIAQELHISNRKVEFHLSNIYAKLDVTSRTEAVLILSENGPRESIGAPKPASYGKPQLKRRPHPTIIGSILFQSNG